MKAINIFILAVCISSGANAQENVFGKWITIDDETGDKKSVVEIYETDGKVYGKIVKLFRGPDENPDPVCKKCPEDDPRYMQKVIGMEIMKNMTKDGENEYADGEILKPDEGNIYRCRIWLDEENNLKVRGYWGFLYRTQTWVRNTDD